MTSFPAKKTAKNGGASKLRCQRKGTFCKKNCETFSMAKVQQNPIIEKIINRVGCGQRKSRLSNPARAGAYAEVVPAVCQGV